MNLARRNPMEQPLISYRISLLTGFTVCKTLKFLIKMHSIFLGYMVKTLSNVTGKSPTNLTLVVA